MSITPVDFIIKTTQEAVAADNFILSIPGFINWTFNQGIEENVYERRNGAGERVYDGSKIDARLGSVVAQFSRCSPELLALMSAAQFDAAAAITGQPYAASFRIPANGMIDAATAGIYGEGVPVDDPSFCASVNIGGITQKLTRVDDATFDPTTDLLSYEVLAGGAVNLSDDVPRGGLLTLRGSEDFAAARRMNQLITRNAFEVTAVMNFVDNGIQNVGWYQWGRLVLNEQDNSQIDVSANPVDINFRDETGNCKPELIFPGAQVRC